MGVEIREVLAKKELWSWVRFPNKLYNVMSLFFYQSNVVGYWLKT